ncbi:nitroreductase/quinone reductase family protein [Tsukamurella soli]|uniref:Deazaflavin-dependent oxidoreductase, nitroreductase family n=1 Tax=Tsukamurella soli TaxID=644556 RepID=A0ABP8JG37_9ACTN
MNLFQRSAAVFNKAVTPLLSLPVVGEKLGGSMAVLSYTGRRSGKAVSLPVSYRRRGDDVVVGVAMPDQKSWWRNFTGTGAPVTVTINSDARTGTAVARRDDKGAVTVTITFA